MDISTPPTMAAATGQELPLNLRLKAATQTTHGALDQRLMAFGPFASRDHYTAFLQMQYRFHRDVAALFGDPALGRLLPGLGQRQRLPAVAQDLADLGQPLPALDQPPAFAEGVAPDLPTALGWLYVEEGSNLGAAFLFKAAAALGLDAGFGARHLAPHPQGRAPSWKEFCAQLNAVVLDAGQLGRAEAAAQAAFRQVRAHVEACCPLERAGPAPA